jgi:diguanylate cyclase (GGDEF)-like protein/PAS domain S-box-containing protein
LHFVLESALIYFNAASQSRALAASEFALLPEATLMLGPSESISAIHDDFVALRAAGKMFRMRKAIDEATPLSVGNSASSAAAASPRNRTTLPSANIVNDELTVTDKTVTNGNRAFMSQRTLTTAHVDHAQPDSAINEQLSEELARARASMQSMVEQLATTNEELQASNEELMAANEELQSTNEELLSTNDELRTVNEQYQTSITVLKKLNADVYNMLESTQIGVMFLDDAMCIRKYTPAVCAYLGLRDTDVGRPLAQLALGEIKLVSMLAEFQNEKPPLERTFAIKESFVMVRVRRYEQPDHTAVGWVVAFFDVTQLRRAQQESARLALVAERTGASVLITDRIGHVLWANTAFERLTGYALSEVIGKSPGSLLQGPETSKETIAYMRQCITAGSGFEVEIFNYGKDRSSYWLHLSVDPVLDEHGNVIQFIAVQLDITARVQAERRAEHLATHDPLTLLLNRRGFERRMHDAQTRAKRVGHALSAVLIDCDNFKMINDKVGYNAGDLVLKSIAERMQSCARADDVIARVGGDEFLILLPNTNESEAVRVAERFRFAVSGQPVAISHEPVVLSMSAAVVPLPPSVLSVAELLSLLEHPIRRAKDSGKNRVAISSTASSTLHTAESVSDFTRLQTESNFLHVVKQSIVTLTDAATHGYELLIRGPKGALHSPVDLFRVASEQNFLTGLDLRCLRECLNATIHLPLGMTRHINIYPSTLVDVPVERLGELFSDVGPNNLCLELSEQQILGDARYLLPHVEALRMLGVTIAIDDVGFGRTLIETLILLEPHVIKIDRSFVTGACDTSARASALARLMRAISTFNAEVIAEGVETESDKKLLIELGVKYAQGYYFDRPA